MFAWWYTYLGVQLLGDSNSDAQGKWHLVHRGCSISLSPQRWWRVPFSPHPHQTLLIFCLYPCVCVCVCWSLTGWHILSDRWRWASLCICWPSVSLPWWIPIQIHSPSNTICKSGCLCIFYYIVKILFSKHVSLIKGILLTYASFAILWIVL